MKKTIGILLGCLCILLLESFLSIIFHSSFLHKKMQVNPQHEH